MRVLFVALPALGHLFPMVPLAWALRSAGHEVRVATATAGLDAVVQAGLPAVDVAPGADIDGIFRPKAGPAADHARQLRDRGRQIARSGAVTPDLVLPRFAEVSDVMTDGVVELARGWAPDLVVHSKLQGAGLLAARLLNVPAIEHGFNFLREGDFAERYLPYLAGSFRRAAVPLELPTRSAIHLGPPSMMLGEGTGWSMRYMPYNAGGVLPRWLGDRRYRPRVAVTLGTVVPRTAGVGGLARLLAAAARVDADFILALGTGADVSALGPLPDNVRPVDWVPLSALLATCDAIVHHGGSGSTLTAVAAGVPQLILPHSADQFLNADLVARHGVGLVREPDEVELVNVTTLLTNEALRIAATVVAAEVRSQPAPSELVPKLAARAVGRVSVTVP